MNDGGQRVLRRNDKGTAFPNPDLPTYMQHKTAEPFTETGDIATFEHTDCHDYVACSVTQAYDSPGFVTNGNSAKVTEVTRQFVFIRPELLVVFDRVEATDPSYDKRFLLHAYAAPTVSGTTFSVTNGSGRLNGQTLLPADPNIVTKNGFDVAGVGHPPSSTASCDEPGGTRLEVSPKAEGTRDYFLHVFEATTPSDTTLPSASASEDATSATVTLDCPLTISTTFSTTCVSLSILTTPIRYRMIRLSAVKSRFGPYVAGLLKASRPKISFFD